MIPIFRDRDLQKAISCAMDNWMQLFSFPFLYWFCEQVRRKIVNKMIFVSFFIFPLLPFVMTKYQGSLCHVKDCFVILGTHVLALP